MNYNFRNGSHTNGPKFPTQKFVRCSVRAQIFHLKKLIKRMWPYVSGSEVRISPVIFFWNDVIQY